MGGKEYEFSTKIIVKISVAGNMSQRIKRDTRELDDICMNYPESLGHARKEVV